MVARYAFAACFLIISVLAGCSSQMPQGQFTDEQMENICYPEKMGLPEPTGGLTLAINNEALCAKSIVSERGKDFQPLVKSSVNYNAFIKSAEPAMQAIVANKVADLLLYQRAQKAIPDHIDQDFLDQAANEEVKKYIASHNGNYSEAEKSLAEMGLTWNDYRDYQKRLIIVQSYLAGQVKSDRPLKYSDLLDYYDQIKAKRYTSEPQFQFRLIDIVPEEIEVPDNNDPNTIVDKDKLAMDTAMKIYQKAIAGKNFSKLAVENSMGFAADNGGLWDTVTPGSLAEPYDILEEKAKTMQPGQTTEPIKVDGHIFIMQLIKYTTGSVTPFEQVQAQIEQELKFLQRKQAIDKLMYELVRQIDIYKLKDFVTFTLHEIYNTYKQG